MQFSCTLTASRIPQIRALGVTLRRSTVFRLSSVPPPFKEGAFPEGTSTPRLHLSRRCLDPFLPTIPLSGTGHPSQFGHHHPFKWLLVPRSKTFFPSDKFPSHCRVGGTPTPVHSANFSYKFSFFPLLFSRNTGFKSQFFARIPPTNLISLNDATPF